MALKKYEEANIQAIAESIREKTGTDKTYDTSEMASGVGEVYEAGKKTIYDVILSDPSEADGRRKNAEYTFIRHQMEYIRPPYKFTPTTRDITCFAYNQRLKRIEKQYFDFSNCAVKFTPNTQGHYSLCSNCESLEVFEDIGLQPAYYYSTWGWCYNLHTIELVRSTIECIYESTFARDESLVNIAFEGEIGKNISFAHSPLSVASMKNIIAHLYNYAGTSSEYTYTVTFKASAFAALEAEGATAEYNGVACTWVELIDNKKWKLTKV